MKLEVNKREEIILTLDGVELATFEIVITGANIVNPIGSKKCFIVPQIDIISNKQVSATTHALITPESEFY